MDLPHSVFLRLSCLFRFFLHPYLFTIHCYLCTIHRYLFTIHRYSGTIHRYLFAGTYMFGSPKQSSTQHTFAAPISWALPNAKPSALYEMIYRINEFIKSVSTLFYHLRATSLCFGDAHCSVTSDKSNISTRFLCDSTVYWFSSTLTCYPRYIENLGDRPTNQLPTYLRIDRLKVSPHEICQNGHRGYIGQPRWQHETMKCKRNLTSFKLCSTLSTEKFRTFAHATTP